MKKFWIIATAAGLGFCTYAQTSLSLADQMRLANMQLQGAKTLSAAGAPAKASVSVFYRVDGAEAVERLQALGASVRQQEGNIVICNVPLDAVMNTLDVDGVQVAQLGSKRRLLNNLAREATGVDKVRSGEGLTQPYDGTGVIAAVFDSGIDPNHIAFKDADGNNRVSCFYNSYASNSYPYDVVFDTYEGDDIARFAGDYSETHGTHVLGTIASSYVPVESGNDYSGMAPGSEIVAANGVGYDEEFTGSLRRIADYARAKGKPCVVNYSWGSNDDGPHDGSDTFTQAFDAIAGEEGVHVFIASGNEGQEPIGVYKELTEADNTMQTFIEATSHNTEYGGPGTLSQGKGVVSVWADTDDPVDAFIEIYDLENPEEPVYSLNLVEGQQKFVASGWVTPSGVSSANIDRNVSEFTNVYSNSYMGGQRGVSPINGCYRVEMAFDIKSSTRPNFRRYAVAIRMVGAPGQKLHAYSTYTDSYDPTFYLGFGSKGLDGFEQSTGDGTLNSMACGQNAIIVGAYSTRQGGEDTVSGMPIYEPEPEIHTPVSFSSWGHMLDGTLKPDVIAPGYVIISTMNTVYARQYFTYLDRMYTPVKDVYEDPNTGKPYYWTIMAGTSMATPHMTGVAALWLQADPDLTTEDIRDVIRHTSFKPEDASGRWGEYGLVNAYDGLKYILGESAVKDVKAEESAIMISPVGEGAYEVASPAESGIDVALYNMQGARVASFATAGTQLTVSAEGLAPGVYVLRAATAQSAVSRKIIVK